VGENRLLLHFVFWHGLGECYNLGGVYVGLFFMFIFLVELFGVVDSSSINEDRLSHVFGEVFWFEFFEFLPFGYDDVAVSVFQVFNS